MAGQGIQFLPLGRLPEKWDPVWFAQFCREVLALGDTRNAIEGPGITITGQPGELATFTASDDLQNLLLQNFVLTAPSGFLNFERVLAGSGGLSVVDGGANSNVTVTVNDYGLTLGKLVPLSDIAILGNPASGIGQTQQILATGDKSIPHVNVATLEFSTIDATYVTDFTEAAQDAVGGILADTASIDFTYNDGANTITADLKLNIAPTWTAKHTFSVPINLPNYTVATLPAGVLGDRACVTDALAPAFLAVLVGGGAIRSPAFHNGTTWVAA